MWRIAFFGIALWMLAVSCDNKELRPDSKFVFTEPAVAIAEGKKLLQNGDLILRTDDDIVSASLRNFSKTDKTYSHCGIVYFEDSAWYVYHLLAGDENPSGLMQKERFERFVDAHLKSRYGIFRYSLNEEERHKMQQQVHEYMNNKTLFDTQFDLKSDDKLYCAEMVYKGLLKATNGRVVLPSTVQKNFKPDRYRNKPMPEVKRFEFIALDNLYLNPFCTEIKRFRYPKISLERE
ncbi:MAG: YiiX/YebB-like N1pC/P60 family cysteine hydrolase [Chitinophagaceae bacterium]